jgi:hypothetical protein
VKDYKEGYDTFHPSDLSNEIDDLKLFFMNTEQLSKDVMRLKAT